MKTSISHLPDYIQKDINHIVRAIRLFVKPHMVILFGSFSRGNWVKEEPIEGNAYFVRTSDFDILVVRDVEGNYIEGSINNYLKQRDLYWLHDHVPVVQIISHSIDYLNERLKERHHFFVEIIRDGTLLFDSGKQILFFP